MPSRCDFSPPATAPEINKIDISAIAAARRWSALSRDPGIVVDAPQCDPEAMVSWSFAGSEMPRKDLPYRRTLLIVHGSPSRYLVALLGSDGSAVIQFQIGNAAADVFARRAGVGKP